MKKERRKEKVKGKMRQTTKRRYNRIRQAAAQLYGKMPAMRIYTELAERFDLSDEWIRKILAKKQKNAPP